MKWTESEIESFKESVKSGQTDTWLAFAFDRSEAAIRGARQRFTPEFVGRTLNQVVEAVHKKQMDACESCAVPSAASVINSMAGGQVSVKETLVHEPPAIPLTFGKIPLDVFDGDKWTKIGLVADTHLCCQESRLDALHAQYDLFEREGVTSVFHAGNIVDGYVPRINGASVLESSIDGQAAYCAREYPSRPGITTHFITGNDHEGWWQKEGFNFGAYLQMVCEKQGRHDLKYLGHVEADVELRCGDFVQRLRISHPGGGSCYARSYKGQKTVESLEGGEKPAILVQGHYHVSYYAVERNIHIIGMPGFQSQTIFGRTKNLRYEIGGVVLDFKMSSKTGAITRVRPEFNLFFDRGFYKKFLVSDGVLRGSPVVVNTGI